VSEGHFFPRRRAEAVGGILQRTLDRQGLARRLDRHVPAAVWADAVGADLAARAQPTVLSAGTLHLLVQDHRWRDQIDAARHLIIDRLNRRLGRRAVRALQFGLAHEGALRPAARTAARHAAPAPPRHSTAGVAGSHALPSEVRDALLRAAASSRRGKS
jgi:predicted nucleic acid-binding Zn ribbon protein